MKMAARRRRGALLTEPEGGPILEEVRERIEAALDKLRPGLQADGGDIKLLEVSTDGVVRVALVGTCAGCPMSRMLLTLGIQNSLSSVPEVKRVETVDERIER
jgi:Fe-S cluster biogenesis protein NfuA